MLKNIRFLLGRSYVKEEYKAQLKALRESAESDVLTAVVLGEFSRGKSTFINALLAADLLPMDVLPETALINVLMYGEAPRVDIIKKDGTRESGEASKEFLAQYGLREDGHLDESVSYIRTRWPAPLLKNKLLLVDTPGVSDLSEQQAEITYGFLPRADAIIFLLDATSPLKKSEKEFIERRVMPQGISQIIFVANKIDNLDDEETDEDYEGKLKKRLEKAFGISCDLYMVSAKNALAGTLEHDNHLLEISGIDVLKSRLLRLSENSERQRIREKNLKWKYDQIWRGIKRQLLSEKRINEANGETLLEAKRELAGLMDERSRDGQILQEYSQKIRTDILSMLDKSLKHFHHNLEDELVAQIEEYRGQDFKEFVEIRLQRRVQKEIDAWLGIYTPRINQLILKYAKAISLGLSRHFNQRVQLSRLPHNIGGTGGAYSMQLEAMDISNTDVRAGALAAAGGIGLTLIAGSALMPFVSFAAMPLIRRHMLERKLAIARDKILPELQNQLILCLMKLMEDLHLQVEEACTKAEEQAVSAYKQLLREYQEAIDAKIREKKTRQEHLQLEADKIADALAELENVRLEEWKNA